jgi:hypothetical protein
VVLCDTAGRIKNAPLLIILSSKPDKELPDVERRCPLPHHAANGTALSLGYHHEAGRDTPKSREEVLKSMGYRNPTSNNHQRLRNVLNCSDSGLSSGSYAFKLCNEVFYEF